MNEMLRQEWAYVTRRISGLRAKKRLSFITIHYLYILGMAILGSILLYPAGGIAYIDALFFSMGASTQSGLNTIDVNKLVLYQQIILYLIPMVTNPIVIHGAVVFVRLYWFEKRFQNVVKEAMSWRQTKSRGRPDTAAGNEEKDPETLERGVNGRHITVMDDGKVVGPGMGNRPQFKDRAKTSPIMESSSTSDSGSPKEAPTEEAHAPFRREITFADEAGSPLGSPLGSPAARMPQPRSAEQHIAFLENQRNPKEKGALRIPGPREFEQGFVPETVDDEDPLTKQTTRVDYENGHIEGPPSRSGDRARNNIHFESIARPVLAPIESHRSTVHFTADATQASKASNPNTPRWPQTPGFGKSPLTPRHRGRSNTFNSLMRTGTQPQTPMPYLSWQPTIGRNSAFIDLTEEQREELGGIEYRSLKTLAVILISFFLFWHLVGIITFVPWIIRTDTWGNIVDADGVTRTWWGIFSSATLFNDVGFTLTPDSFISFQGAVLPLLLGAFLIVIGNTGFPCMLRLTIWMVSKVTVVGSPIWEEIRFLLDHPRRCFTLLFPGNATWVLFAILILLNGIDLIFFIVLDLNDDAVTSIPPGLRVLSGLFQATSTRTSGTASVNLANLHPGIQVSYLIMMYISAFPIAISMRRTNVYEEKSLGIYGSTTDADDDAQEPSYVGAHLRKQLGFDLWFIFLGLFIVSIAEGSRLQDPAETSFTIFACLFEIVSAYGTVGLSLGYPTVNASFSSQFTVVSKLIIIAMMLRGRHRGLPYELDRAILLPSENLHKKEDEDANRRATVRRLSMTNSDGGGLFAFPSARTVPHENMFPRRTTQDYEDEQAVQSAPATATGIESHDQALNHDNSFPHPRRGLGRAMAGMASMNDMLKTATMNSLHHNSTEAKEKDRDD